MRQAVAPGAGARRYESVDVFNEGSCGFYIEAVVCNRGVNQGDRLIRGGDIGKRGQVELDLDVPWDRTCLPFRVKVGGQHIRGHGSNLRVVILLHKLMQTD